MFVSVDLTHGQATLEEPDDVSRLHVAVRGGDDLDRIADVLAPLGRLEGDHAFLEVDALRRAAEGRVGDGWDQRFDGMVDHARDRGWLDEDGRAIQAHLEMRG